MLVVTVDNGVNHAPQGRGTISPLERSRAMNPDLLELQVQLEYRRQEMARARGHRNWTKLFQK